MSTANLKPLALAAYGARLTDKPTSLGVRALAVSPNPHDQYVEFLKDLALSMGKKAVLELIIPALPEFMTTGIFGALLTPLLGFIVGKVLEIAIRETEVGLFFLYIDLRTSAQGRDFEKAARQNLDKQRNGTPAEREAAEKELIRAFKAFVKFTN